MERHVPELPGHRSLAVDQLPVQEQADADPLRDRDSEQVADVLGMAAEPELRERAGVGGVLDRRRQADRCLDQCLEIHRSPAEVRREDQASAAIDAARQAHADAVALDAGMGRAERRHGPGEMLHEHGRLGGGRPRRLFDEAGVHGAEPDGRPLGSKVDRQDAGAIGIEVQQTGPTSSGGAAHGLGDPALADQLIDNGGHGAALKAGPAGEVGARHRGKPADEAEGDPAVDLAGRFARRHLEVGQVDFAHCELCLRFELYNRRAKI